jgi:hypothetical protein
LHQSDLFPVAAECEAIWCLQNIPSRSIVGWVTTLHTGSSRVRVPIRWIFFSIYLILKIHYGPGVDSASNRNEYQEFSWGIKGGRRVRLTTLPPSVSDCLDKMWEPRRPTALWAFTACYRDNFTLSHHFRKLLFKGKSISVSEDTVFLGYNAKYSERVQCLFLRNISSPSSGSKSKASVSSSCRLLPLVYCLAYSTLKMEALCSSVTSGSLRTTRYNPEYHILHSYRC